MSKRLVLCLDGTWNTTDSNTNVWRTKLLVSDRGENGEPQLVYYDEGVGTGSVGRLSGGATGRGLDTNVKEAYGWLVEHFETDDQIFLFGFSRGAFTARSVAGMIARCGLLRPGAPLSVGDAYDYYKATGRRRDRKRQIWELQSATEEEKADFSLEERWWREHSRRTSIQFIGVWDTVGALGNPIGAVRGISKKNRFHNTNPSSLYRNIFQALAVDEHRGPYDPTLWTEYQPKGQPRRYPGANNRIEQRWFVGAHSNVGGGRGAGPLGQLPLAWLQRMAEETGLSFKRVLPLTGDEHLGPVQDSFASFMGGFYRLVRFGRRHMRGIGRPPVTLKGKNATSHFLEETIDKSVFERWQADQTYRPRNLELWAKKRKLNLDTVDLDAIGDHYRAAL